MMRYKGGLAVRRVGLSYSIDIEFSATSPEHAATIANATADAYIAEQINARGAGSPSGRPVAGRPHRPLAQTDECCRHGGAGVPRQARLPPFDQPRWRGGRSQRGAAPRANETGRPNTLEELDSTAQTYRRIYESYLMAYTESVQKQSYPVSNARIITAATPPLSKSHPRTKLTLMFGALMGALAGLRHSLLPHQARP